MLEFLEFEDFEWDDGNSTKNLEKHGVHREECEQVFFNRPFLITADDTHSTGEMRMFALGQTDLGRKLSLSFTKRGNSLRVISAREMTKKERRAYLEYTI